MDRAQFEKILQEEFDALPELFQHNLENIRIVVEDQPQKKWAGGRGLLLGLYEAFP